jgi:hypothetical protein
MRLQSLDPTTAFSASFDDLIASTPEPLQDVDAGIMQRLDACFEVPPAQGGGPNIFVPAIIDVPENPGTRNMPYILVTPLFIRVLGPQGGSSEIVDNYTTTGAFVRSAPSDLELEFRVDAFTEERSQKASLLEQLLSDFGTNSHLAANGEALEITFFTPSSQQMEALTSPGRTPLFFRLIARMETGERQFHPMAVPFLMTAPLDGIATAEVTAI